MTQTKQLPKGWKEIPLSEVLDYEQPSDYIVNSDILVEKTPIPVLTANKGFIKGYTKETKGIYKKIPVIIFDDFTADNKFVNFPFKIKSSAMKILKLKDENALLKYIFYQMQLKQVDTGTHKRYYLSIYQNLKFVFPINKDGKINLAKQQTIVEEIEKQLTRLEQAVKALKSVKDKLKVYRKAVLKDAFEEISSIKLLGTLFKTSSGGTPSRGITSYYLGYIPWLKSGELMDKLSISDSEEHISEEALKNSSAKIFPVNTILIALYGATTGKIGVLTKECSTNQAICGILPNENTIPKFIFYYLMLKRESLLDLRKGGAQPNISQDIIKNLDFPDISFREQQKIVQEIESKFSVIDKIEQVVEVSLLKAEKLRKSILKTAFEDKLVKFMEEIKNVRLHI